MEFWIFYLDFWHWVYLIGVPVIIFSVKKEAPIRLKSGRLLFLIFLLPVLTAPLDYARSQTIEGFKSYDYGCWIYDLYFFLLFTTLSIIYTGWWELARRCFHKQLSWHIINDFKYGILSNIVIFISGFITLNYALIFLGYEYNSYFIFYIFWTIKKYTYLNISPLVC